MSPFVKWAGGKTQLIERLREKAPPFFHTYYEPFLGGGALFLHEGYPQAVVSDVNRELINVYRQIRDDVEAVIEAVDVRRYINCKASKRRSREVIVTNRRRPL